MVGSVAKSSSSPNFCAALSRSCRINHHPVTVVGTIPIIAPLPDISIHVIQAPCVGLLLPDRMCANVRIRAIPPQFSQISTISILRCEIPIIIKCSGRTRPTGILPLGFSRQIKAVTLRHFSCVQFVQFIAEFLGIIPRHFLHRVIVTILKLGRIAAHNRLPLALGNFIFSKPVVFG